VTREDKGWVTSRYARLSTGLKMLLWISIWLLPLGLIAILASIDSARQNSAERHEDMADRLDLKAQRINEALLRSEITIGAASAAIELSPEGSGVCATTLRRLARSPVPARYALYSAGNRLRCASPGLVPPARLPNPRRDRSVARIDPGGETLQLYMFDENEGLEGIAEYPRAALAELSNPAEPNNGFDLELRQGDRKMVLSDRLAGGALGRPMHDSKPVADGQLQLDMRLSEVPFSAAEGLMILLPVLMWLFAALIGWLIVDRLLLRPLARMQRAVSAYRPGDRGLDIPQLATPAREIGDLGEAFDQVVQTVARHESNLEAAVERQTRLVREVHHRVKNNLQVVASLLNLHSRGSPNEEVAAAYASIQRRVDALAVVHRNHFAELEENRGVALKPLISELAANLRATAPASAANMAIRLDLEPYYVTQDVAVSVAFLITELTEFAMFRGAETVSVSLSGGSAAGTATLIVESESLSDGGPRDDLLADRFERIVTGLSRQLRSTIDRDPEAGRYALDIAVIDKAER
jgi:two-component sensor histidine kinase